MKLENLCGKHKLLGIEQMTVQRPSLWNDDELEDRNGVAFRMDGVTYLAVENPEDGYRSHCENLEEIPNIPRYRIPDIAVVCSMKPNDTNGFGSGNHNILVVTDEITGKVVMEIGTENYDDYYPCYIFEYTPENLVCNQKKNEGIRYRKRPVEIEAFQYDGNLTDANGEWSIPDWAVEALNRKVMYYDSNGCAMPNELFIHTLEGKHHVSIGDYVIRGVQGELYPCKPDIFTATYEPAV